MKKFVNANLEIISFEMTDIITTSKLAGGNAGNGEDDVIDYTIN